MASIQQRTLKDGSYSYRVAYRVDGRQRTKTFRDPVEADEFAAGIEGPVRRRLEVTALRVDDLDVTRVGGSASVQVQWKWVR